MLRRPWPGHETKERKALDLPVVTKLKDLPTSPSSAGRQPNKHTQDRSRKLQREWDLLRRLPAPYPIKLEALYVKFWPSMFYGMAIAQVTDEEVAQLRTTATKALQAHRAGSNPMLRLSLSSNMQADPGFYRTWNILQDIRRLCRSRRRLSSGELTRPPMIRHGNSQQDRSHSCC